MILHEETIIVYPDQTKTNIVREINAPQDFEKLVIEFEYSPKWVTDPEMLKKLTLQGSIEYGLIPADTKEISLEDCPEICNMIVLSLDINGNFAGYAHRHDPKQVITISEKDATPGFYEMKPEKGIWRLVLAVCCVATSDCVCHIHVTGIEEGEV